MKRISSMHGVAVILNHGNSIVVDCNGIHERVFRLISYGGGVWDKELCPAGWCLGPDGKIEKLQAAITAPQIEGRLVEIARDFHMILRIIKPADEDGFWQLECSMGKNNLAGYGLYNLETKGFPSLYDVGFEIIKKASEDAATKYNEAVLAMDGKLRSDISAYA